MRLTGLVLVAAVALVVSAAGATAATGGQASSSAAKSKTAKAKAKVRAKAKAKALRKCKRIKGKARRKACVKRVNRRFAQRPAPRPAPRPKPSAVIDVRDDYFSPSFVRIRSGQAVKWVWNEINHNAHNVTLFGGPKGVNLLDFETANAPANRYSFQRTFKVPGTYNLVCSLHHLMRIDVEVSK